MMEQTRRLIEQELQKCTEQLAMLTSLVQAPEHETPAYYVMSDGDYDVTYANPTSSCLDNDLYSCGLISKFDILKKKHPITLADGKQLELVIHSTANKQGVVKVCSMSVFRVDGAKRLFSAYMFTTNDPLAFDNFNCYKGHSWLSSKATLKCVEQMVFCENKAQMAKHFLATFESPEAFKTKLSELFVNSDLIVELTGDAELKYDLKQIKERKEKLQAVRQYIEKIPAKRLFQLYSDYLDRAMKKPNNLIPFDEYKQVGRRVILDQKYLDEWDSIAMVCVMSARMYLLERSVQERKLTAALVPDCVVECSKDDETWACKLPENTSLDDVAEKNVDWITNTIEEQTEYQATFIRDLQDILTNTGKSNKDNTQEAMAKLFHSKNRQKLGLSEKLIQSIWTGKLTFPDYLVEAIQAKLGVYGIKFHIYNPDLLRSCLSCYDVANSIGSED